MAVIHAEDHGRRDTTVPGDDIRICFLLDASGSMISVVKQVISGFNEYVQTLKANADNTVLTLVKFNSDIGVVAVYDEKPIADVPALSMDDYHPNGMTPLYDAIGRAITQMDATKGNQNVLFVIQTDGEENMSCEYSLDAVKRLIKAREKLGWTFVYMGADQAAWEVGGKLLGLARGNTMSYGSTYTTAVLGATLADATATYKSMTAKGCASTTFFSKTGVDSK